mmetsp:Transcript_8237/g.16447  ORF Transcript_8237/g.16447 Transcript_8237/m.16447 type:complete len:303 (+) Transcript_8237:1422-2330(+)
MLALVNFFYWNKFRLKTNHPEFFDKNFLINEIFSQKKSHLNSFCPLFCVDKKKNDSLIKYSTFSLKKRIEGFVRAEKETNNLSSLLPGDFGNHSQYLTGLSGKKREGVPHEHIHCFIKKINELPPKKQVFFAQYFFPSPSPKFFRFRLYIIYPCEFSTKEKPVVKMEIIRNSENEDFLNNKDPTKSKKKTKEFFQFGNKLSRCVIFWKPLKDERYLKKSLKIFHGFMENQGCTILASSFPSFLHITDNLLLTPYSFWVNDRGFNEDGFLLYGSKNDVSFQMERLETGGFLDWSFNGISRNNL